MNNNSNTIIPLSKPYLDEDDVAAVAETIRSGWILQGKKVEEFEHLIQQYVGMPYAKACSNCTTGLHLSLKILKIGPGDEVIVPSYSYIATTNCVSHAGATPVFAEINPDTFNIDPFDIEKRITKKTKAIIAVDQMGLCPDWDTITKLAKEYKLHLIEDAACGLGSTYKGKKAGTFGDIAVFSFHPRKAITTAEGGVMVTKNKSWSDTFSMMRAHGASISVLNRNTSSEVLLEEFPIIGYNYRMTDIHASLGISQFKKLDHILQKRKKIAEQYNTALSNNEHIIIPFVPENYTHTFQTYQIRLSGLADKRIKIMQFMLDSGITIRQGIPSAHLQPPYKKLSKSRLPITELASEETVCLPVYTTMTNNDIQKVIKTLTKAVEKFT